MFHLDEYIGIDENHRASFKRYLRDRFLERVSPLEAIYLIDGKNNPDMECKRLNEIISKYQIDVAFVGIGENGHLAFNDPPADFNTNNPFIVVDLDQTCRMQQVKEGWFSKIEDVPNKAISMSVYQIMKSKYIICTVPDERKAIAVKDALVGDIGPEVPASILQRHPNCHVFLDPESASLYLREMRNYRADNE